MIVIQNLKLLGNHNYLVHTYACMYEMLKKHDRISFLYFPICSNDMIHIGHGVIPVDFGGISKWLFQNLQLVGNHNYLVHNYACMYEM